MDYDRLFGRMLVAATVILTVAAIIPFFFQGSRNSSPMSRVSDSRRALGNAVEAQ
jgi:hypothetical protein